MVSEYIKMRITVLQAASKDGYFFDCLSKRKTIYAEFFQFLTNNLTIPPFSYIIKSEELLVSFLTKRVLGAIGGQIRLPSARLLMSSVL